MVWNRCPATNHSPNPEIVGADDHAGVDNRPAQLIEVYTEPQSESFLRRM
jgi:hypothetical protein